MERARDNEANAPPVKLTGRLRMPKAIPAHLQQHYDQQQQQQLLHQQQQLEAQFKSDSVRNPSHLDHDSGSNDVMTMMTATPEDCPSGEWHRDEHNRFMQALETYGQGQNGDEWKKITTFVQTRSIEEVRQHGRQYLQQLVQELSGTGRALQSINSLGFALTPMAATGAGESRNHDNQNDPNGQNHMAAAPATGATGKPAKQPRSRAKSGSSKATNPSSKGSQQQQHQQQIPTGVLVPSSSIKQTQSASLRKNGRKPKVWTFEEDKIFENALANWNSDKPYSWPKIVTALPGKTPKDARNRYEKLVGDIAIIEKSEELAHQPPHHYPAPRSGLSSRISPPPPIEVPPTSLAAEGKGEDTLSDSLMLDSPGLFRSSSGGGGGGSARGGAATKRGISSSSGSMLSPTFLDFLTSEEKQPATSAHDSLDFPSSSSSLLPSPEYSRRPPSASSSSAVSSSSLAFPYGGRSAAVPSTYTKSSSSSAPLGRDRLIPKGFVTPRIWQEFLSDDFKFDVKALSSADGLSGDAVGARSGDGGGGGSGHSTISQDMSNVTLLGSSPSSESPRRAQESYRADEAASALQMECDEPMFEAGEMQEDDEYEDKAESVRAHHQYDQRLAADASRKRPRGMDTFSEVDGDRDIKMKSAPQRDDSRSRSRREGGRGEKQGADQGREAK